MASLHKKFMGVAGPTDVLTFELERGARGAVTAGEVVVCVSYARREARRRGVELHHELLLYALHGILHLSGFDDRAPAGHRRIHEEEDRILRLIGIGPVFNHAPKERGRSKIVTRAR
jgi:probable rRNA maturation factor